MIAALGQGTAAILAALIAAVAAFGGSVLGAHVALSRFKKERAFDRQLDWYERMIRALHHMALRIDIAVTFKDDPTTTRKLLTRVWTEVQDAHIDLEAVANEAPLYGSQDAANLAASISDEIQEVADKTEAFDPVNHKLAKRRIQRIADLADKLRQRSKPLALEARTHLGIK